ncbi:MAG: hypothetical protein HRT81_02385 [Henriciella sp.]|nr:hypothetical protein [Henriciella sp.]
MRTGVFVTFVFLAGCAGSIEKVQAMRADAPEWYEARKQEFRGEGYPDLNAIPEKRTDYDPVRKLELSEAETRAALALLNEDPRSAPADETPEEIAAWAAEMKRAVEGRLPAPDFLTDAEVEEIKARFNIARARL